MDISFIVILGLPVLYLTGSLKKIVVNTDISGLCFVLYFVCTAVLAFLPIVKIMQGIRLDLAGTFFCLAPAVFLAVKKRYTYKHYLIFVLTTLFAVGQSFFSSIYTLPYLSYLVGLLIAVAAVLCFKSKGPIFAPVLMGVYGIASGLMQLFSGMENFIILFGNIGMASLCEALCLFASYLFRARGKHALRHVLEMQDNEG